MKKPNLNNDKLIQETNYLIESLKRYLSSMAEGSGAKRIFDEFKTKLPNTDISDDGNELNVSKYSEASTVAILKQFGYEYKKPIGPELHFFNKDTSISVYLNQKTKIIKLVP